jgi:signal transduction histidine kinase
VKERPHSQTPKRRTLSAGARNVIVFSVALALLSIAGLVVYMTVVRLLQAEQWVSHTREVQATLSTIGVAASRAGRARVEFVHSGDPASVQELDTAIHETQRTIDQVKQQTLDNSMQQNYCVRLQTAFDERVEAIRQSIARKNASTWNLQNEAETSQSIVRAASEMDTVVRGMQREEQSLLIERQRRSQLLFRLAIVFCMLAFVMAIALLGLHYSMLNGELRARQNAEEALRQLNARLLDIQDSERRRISRELHDGLGQYLAGAKMRLESARKELPPNENLAKSVEILEQTISEARTLSHLLHPPLLDEIGFASAASWYVEGFSERSGIQTDLHLPDKLGRLPSTIELTLFRVLQEALTNIHRHSGSRKAEIEVFLDQAEVGLRITDYGRGMEPGVLHRFENNEGYLGVGLTGMKERLRELGGRMQVQSDASGTRIVAALPIDQSMVNVRQDRGANTHA